MNEADRAACYEAEAELEELIENGHTDDIFSGDEMDELFAHEGIDGAANYLAYHSDLTYEEAEDLLHRLYRA